MLRDPFDPITARKKAERDQFYELLRRRMGAAPRDVTKGPEGDGPAAGGTGMLRAPLDFLPGTGEILSGYDAWNAAKEGDGLGVGLGLAGMIPLAGTVGRVGKKAAEVVGLAGGTGKRAKSNMQRSVQGIRDVSPEEARRIAERGGHLKQMPDGQYAGAPRGVNSPAQLGSMRRRVDETIAKGASGGDWYNRARAWNWFVSGGDPARAHLLANEEALWSAQTAPAPNLNEALKAHNAYEMGTPLAQARTGAQATKYREARDAGIDIRQGPKTGEYANKLDPTVDISHIPVNDIWQGRVFGYTDSEGKPISSAFGAAQHAFMDAETTLAAIRANKRKLGGMTNWDAASAQAAPWVYAKGESLHKRFPKAYPTVEDGVAEASKTYPDYAGRQTVNATYERIPGANTGHLPSLLEGDDAARIAYSNDPRASWMMEPGNDKLYQAAGAYDQATRPATGFYRNSAGVVETNPAFSAQPLVGMDAGKGGARNVADADRRMLSGVEHFRAYMDGQEAGAWHRLAPDGKVGEQTSGFIPLDRSLTPDEMRAMLPIASRSGLDLSDTGGGLTLMNFGADNAPTNGTAMRKALEKGELGQSLRGALPDAGDAYIGRTIGDYVETNLSRANEGTGQATQALVDRFTAEPTLAAKLDRNPMVRQTIDGILARDIETASATGSPVRQDLMRAREIFSREGFAGLRKALAAGVALPAAALMVLQQQADAEVPPGDA